MKRCDFWKISLLNVTATPVRSFLTVLGMAIGIGAILAVLTLGDAGKTQVEAEMARLGVDKVWLTSAGAEPLRRGDAQRVSEALGTETTEQAYGQAIVRCGEREAEAVLVGCTQDYLRQMDARVLSGRMLLPVEWRAGSRAVLLGETLARELNAEERKLSVGGMLFTVVGVTRLENQFSQIDAARAVFIPLEVFCELAGPAVQELTVSVPHGETPDSLAQSAIRALERASGREARAVTMQAQIEAARSVIALFVDVLKWVAGICILVGGIGVMNILLVSVRERRREIGVMKSLGASEAQICAMFLLEAAVYAAIGGALGLLVGLGLIRIAGDAIGLSPRVNPGDAASVAAAAVGVGLFFGVAPALRAALLSPVDALRE